MNCHSVRPPKCSIASGAADDPYTRKICWKCTLTRPIRSPFAPLTLKPFGLKRKLRRIENQFVPLVHDSKARSLGQ